MGSVPSKARGTSDASQPSTPEPGAFAPAAKAVTSTLHVALSSGDEGALAKALLAGAEAAAFRPVHREEQYFLFCPLAEKHAANTQLTALGRFASTLLSHIAAAETGKGVSKWDRDTGPRILRMLIKAGADVTAPLHCTGSSASGPLHPGTAALIDALRLIVVAAKRNDQIRRARAAFIAPILIEALSVASHLSAVDLMFWAGLPGGPEVAACVVARQLPILMPPHASSTTASAAATAAAGATALWLQPALIAAVDCGSAAAVKLLLEAGASPDEVSWCRRGVAGTEAAPATGGGREPVAGETPLMRCAGDFAVALPPPDLFGIHSGDYSVGTVTAAAAATSATAGAADVAEEEDSGETDALVHRPTRAMLEALLHAGANADARDSTGRTALHHIAASDSPALRADPAGRLSLALRLLHAGADVGALDQAGRTASQAAALARPGGEQRFVRGLAAAVEEARRKAAAAAAAAAPSSPPTSPKKENSMHT